MAHGTQHMAHGARHMAISTWTRHMVHSTWHVAHGTRRTAHKTARQEHEATHRSLLHKVQTHGPESNLKLLQLCPGTALIYAWSKFGCGHILKRRPRTLNRGQNKIGKIF
eukprot:1162090-Pelagomonas_calceolata.AAC.7